MNRLAASVLTTLAVLATPSVEAQTPTFSEVTGHDFGERITQHHEMVAYLRALERTSPRVTVFSQGESWEGRELLAAIVTAEDNHARLEAIRETAQRLGDPRTTGAGAVDGLIAGQPVIVWLGGSIHGFELSGSEGVLKLLEHLALRDDPATEEVLTNAVILIDPMLNPDGRDAFAHINHENVAAVPNPDRNDWANDYTGWQGLKYRTGHYYFDTNRDWFAHTQRETRARVPTLLAWRPQVAVDLHEMGADAEFYFDPPGDPVGPFFPGFASRWFKEFGRAFAAAFDSAGFEYMTRERYNYFYPGYTTSYSSYQGAVGMLFEQGSSRGLALTRPDGSVRTLADALEQQYVAAWTTARTAVARREELLREYYGAHRAAIADGRAGVRRYFITGQGDPGLVRGLIDLLIRNGIEVTRLIDAVRAGGLRDRTGASVGQRSFPAGTYVVEAAQPRNRLIRALLEPDNPLPPSFLEAARHRVERDENPRFYDITTWSLPLLFNVEVYGSGDADDVPVEEAGEAGEAEEAAGSAGYALALDGRNAASLAVLWHLKDEGRRAAVITAPTRIAGREVPGGSVIVRVGQNGPDIGDVVRRHAARLGVDVWALPTGLSDSGYPSLGSGDHTFNVEAPRIALLAEEPIFGYSFGWAWYTLDRQYDIRTTVLRTSSVADTDLSDYNVIVVPSASAAALERELGDEGLERIDRWVRDGGTLVTIAGASDFAREQFELGLRSWYDEEENEDVQRFDVPGAIFRADVDRETWMSAGYDAGTVPVLVDSDRLYLVPEGPPDSRQRVVARYATESPLLSGHAWSETLERIPGAVFAYEERVGSGRVIAFAEDVNYRGYFRGANRLFLNAVVLGPSAP